MATANTNMFYARPVFVPNSSAADLSRKQNHTNDRRGLVSRMQDTSPPPRPPPPRPVKTFIDNKTPGKSKDVKTNHTYDRVGNLKPLTESNMMNHDRFWEEEIDAKTSDSKDVLTPPLKHITPEMTEEMWKNYDPLDMIDSTSDHSDASVDTMIMMTTEEEKRNSERINQSLQEYTALKNKGEVTNTNKLKNNIQNKNLHLHIPGRNGIVSFKDRSHDQSHGQSHGQSHDQSYGQSHGRSHDLTMNTNEASKFSPLHISTGNHNTNFTPSSKAGGTHGLSNADSPDDGYGTNSSSGTISSPCSSSFNSVITEFDSSYGSVKKVVLPNGAIKPNSVRENWAVRRKQRMIESEDNSVQEQLRHLTSIQEESSEPRLSGHEENYNHGNENVGDINVSKYNTGRKSKVKEKSIKYDSADNKNQNKYMSDGPFISVSESDIEQRNQQLYVINDDRERESSATRNGHRNQVKSQVSMTTREHELRSRSHSGNRLSSSGTVGGANVVSPPTHVDSSPGNGYPNSYGSGYGSNSDNYNEEVVNQGRVNGETPLLRGGSDMKYRTLSGRIYVSASGDEGMYSLNQSSRSTSLSSFQPITDQQQAPGSPQSPLEKLSGDLFEKWIDMDRNYRNYYGFEDQAAFKSRTDSKVNYFQKKTINQMYDQDNYYRSQTTLSEAQTRQQYQSSEGNMDSLGSIQSEHAPVEHSQTENKQKKDSHESGKKQKSGKDSSGNKKSKLFQILPNMFKPSTKKQNQESKTATASKGKTKDQISSPVEIVPTVEPPRPQSVDLEPESEYINIGDLPQYSLAQVIYDERRKRGENVSIDSLRTRPVFASSKDITKLFSKRNMSFDSMTSPGSQRHSFHSMPMSYKHLSPYSGDFEDMRPRAQSTSATMRTRQGYNTVDSRMAVLAQKNLAGMQQGHQLPREDAHSSGNISVHSNTSGNQGPGSRPRSRSRVDSGSSGGDSKLSTLV